MPHELTRLAHVINAAFRGDTGITRLFERFLRRTDFDPDLVSTLIQSARDSAQSWDLRRIAVLMLEHVALFLWETFAFGERSHWLLDQLGLLSEGSVANSVLLEGYSSAHPQCFAMELCTRIARLERIHLRINGWRTRPQALREFIHVASLDCKLTLARYLFR